MKKNKSKIKGLIKLHLLKYQLYKNVINSSINDLSIELKQALKIIYLYNKNKKKIIFIGFPYNKNYQNQTNSLFISKISFIKNIYNNNTVFDLNNSHKSIKLIVFYQTSTKDLNLLKNLSKRNIPVIVFSNNYNLNYNYYGVKGNLKKKKIKLLFSFLILAIVIKKFKKVKL